MQYRCVMLCITGPFAVLGKAKYQYRQLRASTDGRMDATKHIISPASWSIIIHTHTNKKTHLRYQMHYLPSFAVNKNGMNSNRSEKLAECIVIYI